MRVLFVKILRWYQNHCSANTPHCRYTPCCSQYMIDAIQKHGSVKGILIGCLRLLRCNRYRESGYDPVPEGNAISVCFRKTFEPLGNTWKFDTCCLVVTSFMYLCNRLCAEFFTATFMRWYFNDLCCGMWYMACTNLVLWVWQHRISKVLHVLMYIALWGIIWETSGPRIRRTAVFDIWDIVMYVAGGLIYWAMGSVFSILANRRQKSNC